MMKIKSVSLNSKLMPHNSFEHGGNIYRIAEGLGVAEDQLIDFSASINPLGVSRKVKDVIKSELSRLVNYPDPDTTKLKEKLAQHNSIEPEMIICGNGSTELIYLILRALQPKQVLIPAPTFSEYERACRTSDKLQVTSYNLKKENNFKINPDKFINAIRENCSLVTRRLPLTSCDSSLAPYPSSLVPGRHMAFLCNPNNPTGHLLRRGEALKIAEAAKDMKCFLVVDEAFIDFTPEESVIHDVKDNPYLIVLRSMTKFYALTGLRIGYGVFHKSLTERILHFKEPWTVNNLAQKAAVAALEDGGYSQKTFKLMKDEKDFLEKGFKKLGIRFYPSDVNYYLLNVEIRHAVLLLRQKGILVRDCSNFKGLDGSYIRVAVKSRKHNKILLKELKDLCTE